MRRRRGYLLLPALILLTVTLSLLMVSGRAVVNGLADTKRRERAAYARELASSGLDWGAACARSRGPCDRTLRLQGGEVIVSVAEAGDGIVIHSEGRVLVAGKLVAARRDEIRIKRPSAE